MSELFTTGDRLASAGAIAIWAFLNTNFSAALFGALAGALAAHSIGVRTERRKRLRDEIAGVNNAVALANTISNAFLALKRQHVRDMAKYYKRQFDAYIAALANPPPAPQILEYFIDFRTLTMPFVPIVELRKTLLERVQSCGAAISISVVLHQSLNGLGNLLVARSESLAKFQGMNEADRVTAYFGLRRADGHIDERIPNQLTGIISYVDDAIYFSMLMVEVLLAHGERLRAAYGRGAPAVSRIDYKAVENGLIPDVTEFPDFEKAYRPVKSPPRRALLQRIATRVRPQFWRLG